MKGSFKNMLVFEIGHAQRNYAYITLFVLTIYLTKRIHNSRIIAQRTVVYTATIRVHRALDYIICDRQSVTMLIIYLLLRIVTCKRIIYLNRCAPITSRTQTAKLKLDFTTKHSGNSRSPDVLNDYIVDRRSKTSDL